ncbi:unnamed protein product [Effrenium voratum]|nr:unnamed protein product [Effrenium voratum]
MQPPRDSLAARMLQRGTLPGLELLGKVAKATPFWPSKPEIREVPSVASVVSTPKKCPPSASSRSPATSSTRTSLGSRIRASLSAVFQRSPSRRKVGKQRPSQLVPVKPLPVAKTVVKPRRRKHGKQRPSVLLPPEVMKLPRPCSEQRAASAAPPAPPGPIAAAGRLATPARSTSKSQPEKEKRPEKQSQGQSRAPSSDVQRPSSERSVAKPRKEPITKRLRLTTPKREEDNYEISDLEEDEHGNRVEPDRSRKRMPSWCANYKQIAETQGDIDPDSIFGSRMPLCDLELIFPDSFYQNRSSPVKRRRGSSCHWFRDALTKREIQAYAFKMGQKRSWSTVRASLGVTCRARSSELPKNKVVALVKPAESQ